MAVSNHPLTQVASVAEAIAVLNACTHRGARLWRYDDTCRRVLPEGWNGLDEAAPPAFTAFEALAIARGLAQIGATAPVRAAPA
jgi:hypothetical protein